MIKFCKKSVHSLLNNITSSTLTCQQVSITTDHQQKSPGLIFLTNFDDVRKPNNVIESSSLINSSGKIKEAIASKISPASMKRDHIAIRSNVLGGGGDADGLALCTESLGFESCTERSMSSVYEKYGIDYYEKARVKKKSKSFEKKKERNSMRMKVFPPPLKSLNDNGKPIFMLKPERKDGRLKLTQVQVQRQESLYATRENGRLRMYLVERRNDRDHVIVDAEDKSSSGDTKDKQVVEEELKVPEDCSGGEDCRALNEVEFSHSPCHHHESHNMHGWGQQCVSIK